MKKLGKDIERLVSGLAGGSEQARINMRASQVRDRYRSVIQTVYRDTADLFLAHTNNVYIMNKDGIRTLIVYVDDSLFSAELNAQRELIKLKMLEMFGERIESFDIYVSRGSYRNNHPFSDEEPSPSPETAPAMPLDSDEVLLVQTTGKNIDNVLLRESFEKAMTADMERKKREKGETS